MQSHCYSGTMPRKVDAEQQKVDIAHALWTLAASSGLESVSLREVAAQAGVSMGRVQYYFRTKEEMLLFGLKLAQQRTELRVEQRLAQLTGSIDAEDVLRAVLDEILSDDFDTKQMIRVSVAYFSRAWKDPDIAKLLFDEDSELRKHAEQVVLTAQKNHRAQPEVDAEKEAHIIWSLASSLSIEVAYGQISADQARSTMCYYLDRVLKPHSDRQIES